VTLGVPLALMRLLQLASPALPVGAYSYSQGMERAVEDGIVRDAASATAWIHDHLHLVLAAYELPCLRAMLVAAERDAPGALRELNAAFLASRESLELRAETLQMGRSLARLLGELQPAARPRHLLEAVAEPSYPCAFACAAACFALPDRDSTAAYLWSWLENQALAAIKLVPLGQSAGQRLLFELSESATALMDLPADAADWSNLAPGLALASVLHETQYSRLFRS